MSSIIKRVGPMYNPPSPGEVLRELYFEPLGLTITEAAKALGVSRTGLSQFVNGRARISLDMAMRLSKALRTSAEMWLDMQRDYDLWQIRKRRSPPIVKLLVTKRAISA